MPNNDRTNPPYGSMQMYVPSVLHLQASGVTSGGGSSSEFAATVQLGQPHGLPTKNWSTAELAAGVTQSVIEGPYEFSGTVQSNAAGTTAKLHIWNICTPAEGAAPFTDCDVTWTADTPGQTNRVRMHLAGFEPGGLV